MEQCSTVISACGVCWTCLGDGNTLKAPLLHTWDEKGLRDTWEVDYIGPFRVSEGKQYILVGVEVISGLTEAEAFRRAMGVNTVKVLKLWFSCLLKPKSIQSDNGSHFTAGTVQEWARGGGIQWVFHTPHYPQEVLL